MILTPNLCGECFIFYYYSLLPQEYIHNLSCMTGKILDEITYIKYIYFYQNKKSKKTPSPNITSLLTILQAREKAHIYSQYSFGLCSISGFTPPP